MGSAEATPGGKGLDERASLFLVHGDLVRLAADDVLVPTDAARTVTASLVPLLPEAAVGEPVAEPAGGPADGPGGSRDRARRVTAPAGRVVPCWCDPHGRHVWLVETAGQHADDDEWIVGGVEAWLAEVAARETAPLHGRARRLAALPLVGTGGGRAAGRRGDLLHALLPRLHAASRDLGVDVACVLGTASDYAAAQRVRADLGLDRPLEPGLQRAAAALGERLRADEVALFVGAGVSASAGLPLWAHLVELLAREAGFAGGALDALADLPPQDAVSLVARRLGAAGLRRRIAEIFADRPHALTHALLAALPVRETVTTNFDTLLESAAAGAGRPLGVVPRCRPEGGRPWLLKMHGDVALPETVVLTREEFLEYEAGRGALAGVVEALLLTRHVLFVGLSMLDDNLVRIAHRVAQVRPEAAEPIGTRLALRRDELRRELWSGVLDEVAMADAGVPAAVAARRLEVFLDAVGAGAAGPVGYLLDPAYAGMLTAAECELARRLTAVAAAGTGAGAAGSPGWAPVADVLARLGWAPAGPPG